MAYSRSVRNRLSRAVRIRCASTRADSTTEDEYEQHAI